MKKRGLLPLIPADKTTLALGDRQVGTSLGRLSDKEIYDVVSSDNKVQLMGPAGSCWAADTTRCLHYGSRGNKKLRCHLQIQFVSRFSPAETLFHFSKVNAKLPEKLSKLQKMALSGTRFVC